MYLQLNSISKVFQETDKETLQDISLTVEKGEFICIVGPSGCGKSTLLNLVAGLDTPSEGSIILDGDKVQGPGADRVVMFQEAALYPWLNVMENVMFGLAAAGHDRNTQCEIAERYLRMVQLWHYREYPIHQISGGMKQRTALARALAPGRAGGDLGADEEDHPICDPQCGRGGLFCRPGCGNGGKSRTYKGDHSHQSATAKKY